MRVPLRNKGEIALEGSKVDEDLVRRDLGAWGQ